MTHTHSSDERPLPGLTERLRLDKWLWAARFYKTRSLAAEYIYKGRVQVNDQVAKASRELKAGDVVSVRVLEVDVARKRIALTMRLDDATSRGRAPDEQRDALRGRDQRAPRPAARAPEPRGNGMMADALRQALKR